MKSQTIKKKRLISDLNDLLFLLTFAGIIATIVSALLKQL